MRVEEAVYGNYRKPMIYGALSGMAFGSVFVGAIGLIGGPEAGNRLVISSGMFGIIGAAFGALYGARSIREWEVVIDDTTEVTCSAQQ